MFAAYDEAVDYILNIPRFTTKNEPEKTGAFLHFLGDLSEVVPCIHVAGTNGKGSVSSFLQSGLNEAGYSVGMFVSPHLVDIRERFSIDGKMIERQEFLNVANFVYDQARLMRETPGYSAYHPTFFEFLFFMAVVWFKSKKPDFLVLETGLGGRLDATNSISSPKVCVITEIGLDHMEYLGDTCELIAMEKAGIMKAGIPVVFADRKESVSKVLSDCADRAGAPRFKVSASNIKNFGRSLETIDFSISSRYDEIAFLSLKTRALYQIENSMLAYEAVLCLKDEGYEIDTALVRQGFSKMKWPGRMEEVLPGVIVDGAHNEDGIDAFLESVKGDGRTQRSLLYSAVSDKQIETVASKIRESRLFDRIFICHLDSYRAADSERMLNAFSGCNVSCFDSVESGLNVLLNESGMKYVAGSLYLVGEVKAILDNKH